MPYITKKKRDYLALLYDKALQNRSMPREQWPRQIMGQNVNVKMMNLVEDFYNLEETNDHIDQNDDYNNNTEPEPSAETAAAFAESLEEN